LFTTNLNQLINELKEERKADGSLIKNFKEMSILIN